MMRNFEIVFIDPEHSIKSTANYYVAKEIYEIIDSIHALNHNYFNICYFKYYFNVYPLFFFTQKQFKIVNYTLFCTSLSSHATGSLKHCLLA
jgi:hypothetical protein